jgi:protein-tyrosine phosphatase
VIWTGTCDTSSAPPMPATVLARGCCDLLDHRGHLIVIAARLVGWAGPGAVLVHCALGNDRTDVVIALLLDAVGVHRAAILADYAATNDVLATALPELAEALGLTDRLELIPFAVRWASTR